MTLRRRILRLLEQEDLNFLVTNWIPRRLLTRFAGWFSRVEQPVVRDISIVFWRFFSDLDLSEASTSRFRSLHHCFTRQLKHGARPIDPSPSILVSPCDAIVGAHGRISGTHLYQIKGRPYAMSELLCDNDLVEAHRDGCYVTLRLTASMYHRFHAPHDCRVDRVWHIAGDVWNVNPAALRRVAKLYCKNERAVLRTRLSDTSHAVTLVAVGAVLVGGIHLHFLDIELRRRRHGPVEFACNVDFRKGDEIGFFHHGSTIIVFGPDRFSLCENVREGAVVRVGERLMRLP